MKRKTTTVMTLDQYVEHVAAQLDAVTTIAGAAGNYRRALEHQGFDAMVSQMLAAQWASAMQSAMTGRVGGAV